MRFILFSCSVHKTTKQNNVQVKSFNYFYQDLSEELESELSGNFRSCAKALCLSPDVYDASEIKRAIKVRFIPS